MMILIVICQIFDEVMVLVFFFVLFVLDCVEGFCVWDMVGCEYIDFVCGIVVMLFGYGYLELLKVLDE